MKKLITILCLMFGCAEAPGILNEEVDPPPNADEAYEIIIEEYIRRAEFRYRSPNELNIRWFNGKCLFYEEFEEYDCIKGAYWETDDIHLTYEDRVYKSAAAHEFLHWLLVKQRGDGDADHSLPEWDAVGHINDVLIEMDL